MTELNEALVSATVVVARLPVVDTKREIVGFELLHRSMHDSDATSEIDANSVFGPLSLFGSVDVNLSAVVGDKLLFCPVDREAVLSKTQLSLPPRKTVIQVPTDEVNADYLAAVRAYTRDGFMVVVEHTTWTQNTYELLALADLVKVDIKAGTPGEVMDVVASYDRAAVDLVAVGCDTKAELTWAQAVGFDFFMGRAVQAHESTSDAASAPLPFSQLELGAQLLGTDLDLNRIEEILRGDPALVMQLLNMASNGAGGGLRRQVHSLREALVFMGTVRLRQWAGLVILSRHSRRQTDALVTTLMRARMCELLAPQWRLNSGVAFTAGLLSGLSIMFNVSTAEIEEQVTVDEELAQAAFHRQGPVGQLIDRVEKHERSLQGTLSGDDDAEVTLIAAQAFAWATRYAEAMDEAETE